jgi:putative tricarboxylic transport membrane protein
MRINREQIGGLLFLALFVCYGVTASSIPLDFLSEQDTFNARSLPIAVSVAGSLVSLMLILSSGHLRSNGVSVEFNRSVGTQAPAQTNWRATLLLVLLMFLYGLVLDYLGFLIATTLFLTAGYWIMGERHPGVLILASLPVVVGIWLIMTSLDVYLAPGELYYDIMEYSCTKGCYLGSVR